VTTHCPECGHELAQGQCPVCEHVVPYRSSASQIETAELCFRKWFLDKVEGLPRTSNRYAEYGTLSHAHLERWFTDHTPPPMTPEGRTSLAILRCLPPPQTPGIEVEKEISISVGGVPFLGYVDLRILDRPVPFISDHKTTSDLKWAKTPAELATSVQPALYAAATFEETRRQANSGQRSCNASTVELQWTYGTRHKSPQVLPVRALVCPEDIAPRMQATADTAHVLQHLWTERPSWRDVPYDAQGCEAFGGCPFQSICNLSPQEKIGSIMSQQSKSDAFRAKLLAAKAAKSNGAAAPATVPATSGTVNPPEAPAVAATSPEPEPAKPAKTPRKPRKKKADTVAQAKADGANAARDLARAASPTGTLPSEAAMVASADKPIPYVPTPEPEPEPAPMYQSTPPIGMLTQQYAAGFRDGFELGRGVK